MARREGEIVRVRDKQLYLREDVAWTDAGHQRLEKKIAEDSVDEERRCQHAADPPRFAEHQQQRCQRHPENTGVSQTGNKTHASKLLFDSKKPEKEFQYTDIVIRTRYNMG